MSQIEIVNTIGRPSELPLVYRYLWIQKNYENNYFFIHRPLCLAYIQLVTRLVIFHRRFNHIHLVTQIITGSSDENAHRSYERVEGKKMLHRFRVNHIILFERNTDLEERIFIVTPNQFRSFDWAKKEGKTFDLRRNGLWARLSVGKLRKNVRGIGSEKAMKISRRIVRQMFVEGTEFRKSRFRSRKM